MAFVVEDGTGLPNSNSYVTVLEYRDYYTDRGIDKISETDAQIQGYLVQSTEFIDLVYEFCGTKLLTTQALDFPRLIEDEDGVEQDSGIPQKLKYATIIMGNNYSGLSVGGSVYVDPNKNIKSLKEKVGPIETNTAYVTDGYKQSTSVTARYPEVTRYLEDYVCDDGLSNNQMRVTSG